ncbi:MAG: transporter [Pandoraea sp.]|uniref:transporter n=1 Tax=Pandoraea sp. TaxID=1883445 RepID=UPI0011F78230|nr:transporter [Pandoraea sp.]TAM13706.1 MAG: transporter [Pandoraea sp.]
MRTPGKLRRQWTSQAARRLVAGVSLAAATTHAWAAPITFNTALPVAQGDFVWREQALDMLTDRDPSPANQNIRVTGLVSVLAYGVTGDFTLFGMQPYLDKQAELTEGGQRRSLGSSNFGDLTALGRYTVFQRNGPGRSFRIAPFVGIKLPTGKDDATSAGMRLPMPLQPGSGSWDPLAGVVVTYQTLENEFDVSASYQRRNPANGFKFGDTAELDASWQYRLWPRSLHAGVPGFLYAVLEANLIHDGRNQTGGVDDANSGGTRLFVAPGLQYVTKSWVLEGALQLPVVQNLNGTAVKTRYGVTLGFRLNF